MDIQLEIWITFICLISLSKSNNSIIVDPATAFEPGTESCRRPGIKVKFNETHSNGLCYELTNTSSCFGVRLNYTKSSPELAGTNYTQHQIQNELTRWSSLQNSPKCWNVIQQLLCAYFMPKCNGDGSIELPTQELCKITRSYCKVIEHIFKGWPEFLQCEDTTKFSNCKGTKNDNKEGPRFNSPSTCMEPMIQVNNPMNFYEGFEGCGLKCQNPLYTDEDHTYISSVIYYANIVSFACTSIVAATFVLDWKSSNIYPTIIILFINICYSVATFGWLIQFLPNSKQDVVCKKDGTVRRNEYNSDENIFCFSGFLLIYIGSMAAIAWLVVLAYVMHIKCSKNVGEVRELLDKKMYFHAFAWCVPFILSVLSSFVLRKLEGDTMSGICFIGYSSPLARVLLLLLPVVILVSAMTFFLIKGICSLNKVANTSFITDDGKRKQVMRYIWKLKGFTIFAVLLIIAFVGLDIHQMLMRPEWQHTLRETLMCRLNLTEAADCLTGEKPGITEITLLMVLFPIGGILVSSWAWTEKTFFLWKSFLSRVLCCRGCHDNVKTSSRGYHPRAYKHELIAKAYERRHEIPLNGGVSISIDTPRDDLVGLNRMLDPTHLHNERGVGDSNVNHSEQNGSEISTTWAAALPHLVTRRNGIAPPASSNSVSCVSEENSRRPSYDSAMSEHAAARQLQNSISDLERYGSRRSRSAWYKFPRNWKSRRGGQSHGGSSSSLESYGPPKIHSAITALIDRRLGRAGCEDDYVPNNQRITVKELAIQTGTSIEKLSHLPCNKQNLCGPQGNLTHCDKQTQWSRSDLTDVGRSVETQTKKSFTKKCKKRKEEGEERDNQTMTRQDSHSRRSDEAVKQLLLPGSTSK